MRRRAKDCLLRLPAGGRQAVGPPILVDGAAADHRVDRVAVGQCAGKRLEDHDPRALAADVAVGLRVEGLAMPFGRQEPRFREAREDLGHRTIHTAGQRNLRLAVPEAPAGEMDRHQRGGARSIDRQARAPEVEEVRDPVSRDAARVTR